MTTVLLETPGGLEQAQEQRELRQTVRRFLRERSPESQVRLDIESDAGYDRAVWRQLAQQLGVQGLGVPERLGGSGASHAELFIVLEEMGRALYCSPFFATVVLAASTLLRSGDKALCGEVLPAIVDGERTATLAVHEENGDWRRPSFCTEARREGDAWVVSGTKSYVIDGASADGIIVAATGGEGVHLLWVDGNASGLTRSPLQTLDKTRRIATLEFQDTPARLIECRTSAAKVLDWVREFATIAQAAEQVGAAEQCLESSVEYAKVRYQFGRPIGAFQAIKHKCCDMLIAVESARALAQCAYAAVDDPVRAPLAASIAGATCTEAFIKVAAEHIQTLGGIGFTWEHPAHLYFRRAKSSEFLFGTPGFHRERAAQHLGVSAGAVDIAT